MLKSSEDAYQLEKAIAKLSHISQMENRLTVFQYQEPPCDHEPQAFWNCVALPLLETFPNTLRNANSHNVAQTCNLHQKFPKTRSGTMRFIRQFIKNLQEDKLNQHTVSKPPKINILKYTCPRTETWLNLLQTSTLISTQHIFWKEASSMSVHVVHVRHHKRTLWIQRQASQESIIVYY